MCFCSSSPGSEPSLSYGFGLGRCVEVSWDALFPSIQIPGVRAHEEMLWLLETALKRRFPSNEFQKKGEFVIAQQLSESIPPAARPLLSVARRCHLFAGGGKGLSGLVTKPSPPLNPKRESFVLFLHGLQWLPTAPRNLKRKITSGFYIQDSNKNKWKKCKQKQPEGLWRITAIPQGAMSLRWRETMRRECLLLCLKSRRERRC